MKRLLSISIMVLIMISSYAQRELEKDLSGYRNSEELVTLSETLSFNDAIAILSKVSERLSGKRIVSTVEITAPIGVQIEKMPYMKALLIIVQYKNLIYEEKPDLIVVKTKTETDVAPAQDIYAAVDSREIKISALFFEANIGDIRERGINWEWLLSKGGLSIGSEFVTFAEEQEQTGGANQQQVQKTPDFLVGPQDINFEMGDFEGTATALFKFFESENLGEIIAHPTVTVRDRTKGRIQIGSDISIKQRDFAGNVIDNFVSTGTIVEVTPYLYNEDDIDYVLLKLDVERSSANPDVVSTEIRKTKATTEVLMIDGEETVIGGLYVNEETEVRRGIPFLKDLPWWVLGIRYLTGYNETALLKQEVIILLHIEILPTLKERVADLKEAKQDKNPVKQQLSEMEERINRFKSKELGEDEK